MNALQHAATSNLEVQQSQTARSKMLQGYQQNRSKTHDSAHKLQIIFFSNRSLSRRSLSNRRNILQRTDFHFGWNSCCADDIQSNKVASANQRKLSSSWKTERAPTFGLTFRRDVIHPASMVFELIPLTVTP
jgi:hypothetical protein